MPYEAEVAAQEKVVAEAQEKLEELKRKAAYQEYPKWIKGVIVQNAAEEAGLTPPVPEPVKAPEHPAPQAPLPVTVVEAPPEPPKPEPKAKHVPEKSSRRGAR